MRQLIKAGDKVCHILYSSMGIALILLYADAKQQLDPESMQVHFFEAETEATTFFCNGLGLSVLVPLVRKNVTLNQGYVQKCIFIHSVVFAP